MNIEMVVLPNGREAGKYPVTVEQWLTVMGTVPEGVDASALSVPVTCVTYEEVQEFLRRLNETVEGEPYRLPSRRGWEYAARADADWVWSQPAIDSNYFFGSDESQLSSYAWYDDKQGAPMPVGQLAPNAWGLYDVHGNVHEMIGKPYPSAFVNSIDNLDAMGGSFASYDFNCSFRKECTFKVNSRSRELGFRVFRGSEMPKPELGYQGDILMWDVESNDYTTVND